MSAAHRHQDPDDRDFIERYAHHLRARKLATRTVDIRVYYVSRLAARGPCAP